MIRAQLYIPEDVHRRLRQIAGAEGTTISELVRRAVDRVYLSRPTAAERVRALEGVTGLWRDRDDLGDEKRWLRSLRRSPVRLGRALARVGRIPSSPGKR